MVMVTSMAAGGLQLKVSRRIIQPILVLVMNNELTALFTESWRGHRAVMLHPNSVCPFHPASEETNPGASTLNLETRRVLYDVGSNLGLVGRALSVARERGTNLSTVLRVTELAASMSLPTGLQRMISHADCVQNHRAV